MDHWISGISTHCAFSESATVHWMTAVCACGQVFTESSMTTSYRTAATQLARKMVRHVTEESRIEPYDFERPPRVEDA